MYFILGQQVSLWLDVHNKSAKVVKEVKSFASFHEAMEARKTQNVQNYPLYSNSLKHALAISVISLNMQIGDNIRHIFRFFLISMSISVDIKPFLN